MANSAAWSSEQGSREWSTSPGVRHRETSTTSEHWQHLFAVHKECLFTEPNSQVPSTLQKKLC